MRLGDLDGLRVVYDRQGRPILEEGESMEAEWTATTLALYEGKRAKGQPLLHHDQGEVGCTMTNRRLIVLIDPSLEKARRVLQLPGDESYTKGMELFEVIQGHGRYYLVLEWSEIPKIKVPSGKRETSTFAVIPAEGAVHTLLVDRETCAWTERVWRMYL
jgi:hypothetical protein